MNRDHLVIVPLPVGSWDPHLPPGADPECPCGRAAYIAKRETVVTLQQELCHFLQEMSVDCECVRREHEWVLEHTPAPTAVQASNLLTWCREADGAHYAEVRCLTPQDNQRFLRLLTSLAALNGIELHPSGQARSIPTAGTVLAETTLNAPHED